jgi:hypothetical protein
MLGRWLIKIVISIGLVAGLSFVPGQSFGEHPVYGQGRQPREKRQLKMNDNKTKLY